RGVQLMKTGMLIAVPRGAIRNGLWSEAGALWHLWKNGRAHGIKFQWIASSAGIRRIAPIEAIGGIFIPSVSVVDVLQLITSLQSDAIEKKAEIHYSSAVQAIVKTASHYVISTPLEEFAARTLVNSAGLSAPAISQMAGGPVYSIQLL